ncbi:ATP-binding protein [Candidatus Saganbacteria bacterium]|nr:ATP-binding protein [Candidatus Saganbacteria bacterium]
MEIKRHILAKLLDDLKEKYVTILVGARQVGKTFLLKKIEAEAKSQNLKTAFFDLEQPETLSKFNMSDAEIVVLLAEAGDVVFIDEFHYLKNASRIFKALYDKGAKVKIFASGSSSLEIHKHLKESLVGRKMVFQIPPCSLAEIGQAAKGEAFNYYCRFGGLPGLIHFEDEEKKRRLLADILQSYLLKDIKSLIKEENIRAFNNLLYLLAQSQGSITSTASLANEVGLTARTIESYLELLAQTYVNHPLHSFSLNYGNELKKSKKYYLFDLGLRNVLLKNFASLKDRQDAGVVIESFVFLELQKLLSPETELRFWRLKDGTEVDFIWVKNQEPYPIEVKMTSRPGEIPDGLRAFINKYPKVRKAFVVGRNNEGQVRYRDTVVYFVKLEDACLIPERI